MNSLMLHGMIYARYAERLGDDPNHDFADEVHSYFGTGTQLQEMYITPTLLSNDDWDVLAETAKWSREQRADAQRLPLDRRRSRASRSLRLGVMVERKGDRNAAQSQRQATGFHRAIGGAAGTASRICEQLLRPRTMAESRS